MLPVEPTAADVDLVQGIFGRGQHPHVWPEFLSQRLDDVLGRCCAGHSDALGGKVAGNPVLEVEPHHAMELQVLLKTERRAGLRKVPRVQAGCYSNFSFPEVVRVLRIKITTGPNN